MPPRASPEGINVANRFGQHSALVLMVCQVWSRSHLGISQREIQRSCNLQSTVPLPFRNYEILSTASRTSPTSRNASPLSKSFCLPVMFG